MQCNFPHRLSGALRHKSVALAEMPHFNHNTSHLPCNSVNLQRRGRKRETWAEQRFALASRQWGPVRRDQCSKRVHQSWQYHSAGIAPLDSHTSHAGLAHTSAGTTAHTHLSTFLFSCHGVIFPRLCGLCNALSAPQEACWDANNSGTALTNRTLGIDGSCRTLRFPALF